MKDTQDRAMEGESAAGDAPSRRTYLALGLMAALGATGALMNAASGVFTMTAVRQLSHALGRGDRRRFEEVFNATLLLFVLLGAPDNKPGILICTLLYQRGRQYSLKSDIEGQFQFLNAEPCRA